MAAQLSEIMHLSAELHAILNKVDAMGFTMAGALIDQAIHAINGEDLSELPGRPRLIIKAEDWVELDAVVDALFREGCA